MDPNREPPPKLKVLNLVRVMQFLRPYRGLAGVTVLMLLVNVGIEAVQPQIARGFLNGLILLGAILINKYRLELRDRILIPKGTSEATA